MSSVNNHTTCIVFSVWLSSVFQIGKAAPPSPSKDRKKDMGSPLRNPGSPMRKNSQSDRRYFYRSFTTLTRLHHNIWPTGGAVSTGRQWRSGPARRAPRLMWTDTRSGSERFTRQTETQPWEDEDVCVHLKKYPATQRMCSLISVDMNTSSNHLFSRIATLWTMHHIYIHFNASAVHCAVGNFSYLICKYSAI